MEFNRRGGGGDRGPRVAGVLEHVRAGPHTTRLPNRDSTRADDQLQRTRAPARAKSAGCDRVRALDLSRARGPGSLGSDWANAIGNASGGASSAARRATDGAL